MPKIATKQRPAPKSGKGYTLNTRITGETREALEAEAGRTGRSISQVAELWLEQGRALSILARRGPGVSDALTRLAVFAADLEEDGLNPERSRVDLEALRAGWIALIRAAFPHVPETHRGVVVFEKRELARQAADAALEAIDKVLNNGGGQALRLGALGLSDGAHAPGPVLSGLFDFLRDLAEGNVELPTVNEFREYAAQAAAEIDALGQPLSAAVLAVDELSAAANAYEGDRREARERGLAIADRYLRPAFGGGAD